MHVARVVAWLVSDDAADVTPRARASSTGPIGVSIRWRSECSSDVDSPARRATSCGTCAATSTSSCRASSDAEGSYPGTTERTSVPTFDEFASAARLSLISLTY